MFHLSPADIFGGIIVIGAFAFFAWMFYLIDPKHPERLAKLRREVGIEDPTDKREP